LTNLAPYHLHMHLQAAREQRASGNSQWRSPTLEDVRVYVSPGVTPGRETLHALLKRFGGQVSV
jgi:hypothetical protein